MGIETSRLDGYLLTFHNIPHTPYKVGYLPRSTMPEKPVLEKLYRLGRQNRAIFIKIEPYVEKGSKLKIMNQELVSSPHPLFPKWTQILDLTKSEEDLFKNLHPKTRYNIRLAEKKGVKVFEESNDIGFKDFAKLYFETTKRQRYFGHTMKYHQTVWDNLKKDSGHILVAYYDNVPLAAYQLWYRDGIMYYVYGGTSDQMRNLMASNLLMWEAIKLGKKLGAKKFDMWGSLPPNYDQSHSWAGFTRFKSGYGTKFVEFVGSYDLVINPSLYYLYNIVYRVRELILKLRA